MISFDSSGFQSSFAVHINHFNCYFCCDLVISLLKLSIVLLVYYYSLKRFSLIVLGGLIIFCIA